MAILLLAPSSAYARQTTVSLDGSSLIPIKRISYTGNGQLIQIKQGDNLILEGIFEGGNGQLRYAWAVSIDGGSTYTAISSDTNSYKIVNATPLEDGVDYVYRLYASDVGSVQRMETLFHVHVIPDKTVDPPPVDPPPVDPPPVDPPHVDPPSTDPSAGVDPSSPASPSASKIAIGAKTADTLFDTLLVVLAVLIVSATISYYSHRSSKGWSRHG